MTVDVKEKVYALANVSTPSRPVTFDPNKCNGCNRCVDECPMDVFIPNSKKGKPPLVLYPDECWYCGSCLFSCSDDKAIKFNYPLMWRVPWKDKETGKHSWVGMQKPMLTKPAPPV